MVSRDGAVQHGCAGAGQADNEKRRGYFFLANFGISPQEIRHPQAGREDIHHALAQHRMPGGVEPGLVLQGPQQPLQGLPVAVVTEIRQAVGRPRIRHHRIGLKVQLSHTLSLVVVDNSESVEAALSDIVIEQRKHQHQTHQRNQPALQAVQALWINRPGETLQQRHHQGHPHKNSEQD